MSKLLDDMRAGFAYGYEKSRRETARKMADARQRYEGLWVRFWRRVLGRN